MLLIHLLLCNSGWVFSPHFFSVCSPSAQITRQAHDITRYELRLKGLGLGRGLLANSSEICQEAAASCSIFLWLQDIFQCRGDHSVGALSPEERTSRSTTRQRSPPAQPTTTNSKVKAVLPRTVALLLEMKGLMN